jgi:hypothetical protein
LLRPLIWTRGDYFVVIGVTLLLIRRVAGDRLCELLREYELGVRRTIRQIEDVEVVPEFFVDI